MLSPRHLSAIPAILFFISITSLALALPAIFSFPKIQTLHFYLLIKKTAKLQSIEAIQSGR